MSAPTPHVAVPPHLLDAGLSTTKISFNQGTPLLALARQLLRTGNVPEEQVAAGTTNEVARAVFSSGVQPQPQGQRIKKRKFRMLSPRESDLLEPEVKQQLVAIAGSEDLAVPIPEDDQPLDSPKIRLIVGTSTITLMRVSQEKVTLGLFRGTERTLTTSFKAPIDLVGRAFFSDPLPEREWVPNSRIGQKNEYGSRLPARLVESFATLLQDSVRLQALLHGALPPGVSRALYLHGGQSRRNETGEQSRRKTYMSFPLHKSCLPDSGCICGVLHQGSNVRSSRAVTVKVEFSFCGQRRVRNFAVDEGEKKEEIEGSRYCPNHPKAGRVVDDIFHDRCMVQPALSIACVHENKVETKTRPLAIPPTALGAFLSLASASCVLCEDASDLDAAAVHTKVETAVEEAEAARRDSGGSKATANTDREAADTFRENRALVAPYSRIFARPRGGRGGRWR
jgi:hypothetical protein